jgi:hypothetical protein
MGNEGATTDNHNLTATKAEGQQESSEGATGEQQGSMEGARREQQGSNQPIAAIYKSVFCKMGGAPEEQQGSKNYA